MRHPEKSSSPYNAADHNAAAPYHGTAALRKALRSATAPKTGATTISSFIFSFFPSC
ncbi:hypothetical protein TIFTF001_018694 [Ficus carica]|uniref:Uncharacterized protein n=1 Tax=Ficus carica TaxID=3494 RepID=A0AA88ABW7_FICCA|nr:hypothetical protein TIFTF001_018694 [Ficus carica]